MAGNHIAEEQIIDFILGNLDEVNKRKVQHHLHACSLCSAEWRSWNTMLTEQVDEKPSEAVFQRVQQSVIEEQQHLSEPKRNRGKNWYVAVISAAVVLLSLVLYDEMRTQDLTYEISQNEEIRPNDIQTKPDTNRLDLIPVVDRERLDGNVWLNEQTNEMLVEVNGLSPLDSQDYQLWIVDTNDDWNGEVLRIKNGMTRVYYRGSDLSHLRLMKVSVEPRGGSITPTGPEALFVDLEDY